MTLHAHALLLPKRGTNNLAKSDIFDALHGAGRADPGTLPQRPLRPLLRHFLHAHDEYRHVASVAVLLVEVAADRLALQRTDQARLLPRLLQSVFGSGLAWLD